MSLWNSIRTPVTPPAPSLPPLLDRLLGIALAALGFFLPWSVAGVVGSMGALFLLALAAGPALWRSAPWREPTMALGLVLLGFVALHTLAITGVTPAAWHTVNRYHELLLAPLLLAMFRFGAGKRGFFRALLLGTLLYAVAFWVALLSPKLALYLLPRRISAGFGLAVCAFLFLEMARCRTRPWVLRAAAAFLAVTVLFAIDGRTGHIVLLALAGCAAWMHSPRRWRWGAAVVLPLALLAAAWASPTVQKRLTESMAGTQPMANGTLSSTGIRIEMLRNNMGLAHDHYATGAGFANYAQLHAQATQQRYGNDPERKHYLNEPWVRTTNPHNEYLMQLIGGGVAAAALFLAWLALPLAWRRESAPGTRGLIAGLVIAFAIGCLFNSLLMDFVEGHLYVTLLAWLMAKQAGRRTAKRAGVKRVLVVATRQIGDVLLTTPLIHAARVRWPDARIDVLGFAGTLGMLAGNPDINELIATPPKLGWRGFVALVRRLWRTYDLALVTQPGDRAHLMGWIAARQRSGIIAQGSSSNWWKKLLLTHVVHSWGDDGGVHIVREKLALMAPWMADVGASDRVVPPSPSALPDGVADQLQKGAIVLHTPSMWPYKQWPLAHFRELAAQLLARGDQVVLTGSNAARDQECVAALRDLAPAPQLLDLSGQLDFNQLAALFGRTALYIGPDTSVSHLAAACGLPVIAIFGPTNPQRWAPWPASAATQELFQRSTLVQRLGNVTLLQAGGLACVPCSKAGCEDHLQSRSDCLVAITPERVLAVIPAKAGIQGALHPESGSTGSPPARG